MGRNYSYGPDLEILAGAAVGDKRRSPRLRLRRVVCIESRVHGNEFADLEMTENVSTQGLYFITQRDSYSCGMRLEIEFPEGGRHHFTGEVARIVRLPAGRFGIGVRLFQTLDIS